MDPDQHNTSDFDFSQLDQQVNKIMNQTQLDDNDNSADITNSAPDTTLTSPQAVSAAHVAQSDDPKPVRSVKPRGYAMDVIHPDQSNMRPKPAQSPVQALDQPALPEGDDFLLPATSSPDDTPDRVASGYGSGGFSASDHTADTDDNAANVRAQSTETEKDDFEDAVKQFENEPADAPAESSALDTEDETDTQSDSEVDGNGPSDNEKPAKVDSTPQTGALLANNLTNTSTHRSDSDKKDERPVMFSTSDYVAPLKGSVKARKSGDKPWIIALVILIIILIGFGAGYYWLIFRH